MRAANVDVVKRAKVPRGGESQQTCQCKSEEESNGGKEKTAFGTIPDVLMKEFLDARMVQEKEDQAGDYENGEDEQPSFGEHDGKLSCSEPASRASA